MIQASVRDRLLDAALALFVAEGYDSVSVDRVRKTAAVSNGSFFHLFQSKADLAAELLISCVLTYQRHVVAALRGTTGAREGVAAFVCAHVAWVDGNQDQARFMLDEARRQWFAQAAERLRAHNDAYVAAIDGWRAPLVSSGELRDMPTPVFMAALIGPANMLCRLWLAGLVPDVGSPLHLAPDLIAAAERALVTSGRKS